MDALSDPWLWFAATAAGVYGAAVLIIVLGAAAFVHAMRLHSGLCALLGILAASCGAGAGIAMNAALGARHIIIPLATGVLLLCIESWVRPGDPVAWRGE